MIVYRITADQYAGKLTASGRVARWNLNGSYIIYTAGSLSLACLENLVHINTGKQKVLYKATLIEIPENVSIEIINEKQLEKNWRHPLHSDSCRKLGQKWLEDNSSCVLKAPSAIIEGEYNYLINIMHEDFNKVKVKDVKVFVFDERLFNN